MFTLSLTTAIREAAAPVWEKRLTGNIQSFEKLPQTSNLALLESSHDGVFAYLDFHPSADAAVVAYVRAGTLSSDSGHNVLTLFTPDSCRRRPTPISTTSFRSWMTIDSSVDPSYEIVRLLFDPASPPPLPGIVTLPDRLSAALLSNDVHYVRTNKRSTRERLIYSLRFLEKYKSDIVAVLTTVI